MMFKRLFLLALLTGYAAFAAASGGRELEEGLVSALRLKPGTTERAGDSGKAIHNGSPKNLERFAEANMCSFDDNVDAQGELNRVSIRTPLSKGRYARLSCRENDTRR